ncbi:uncharacterized protein LOC129583218 [Paramacrobiotus metropolitanus]|uniref:uncharacterized protein LOC129583218 n=1 Tax=Paramacrobiotus metropolitanus TaxID=2943436 RepID=UPI0024460891|nr:uncharacterized protein LOC129583218 [Paramacrobiotus metropolitanus]XP_055330894.1 uncharacterized protein LOC129583218 [Paramacrobiotus metropolitanus]
MAMNAAVNLADAVLGRKPVSSGPSEPIEDPTTRMSAVVWHKALDMRYELVPRPVICAPTDAIIRVTATSICGSDLHVYAGEVPGMNEGDIVGHEFMGIVEAKGVEVELPIGARVVVAFAIICGKCEFCQRGEFSSCSTTNSSRVQEQAVGHNSCGIFGFGALAGDYKGGQAEYVRVPFADLNCLPIPIDLLDEKALYLSDIIPTSYHAARDVREGDTVAIWGMGPIGLLAARWCQILGARRIVGISGTAYRLDVAHKKLGIEVINYNEQDVNRTLADMEPRGWDVAIDAAGYRFAKGVLHKVQRTLMLETDTSETITECCKALRPFGKLTIIATYVGLANQFPMGMFMFKNLTMRCGGTPIQKLWRYCLEKVLDGTLDPRFVVTHYMRLSEGPEAYKLMYEHEDNFIKALLRPDLPPELKPAGAGI